MHLAKVNYILLIVLGMYDNLSLSKPYFELTKGFIRAFWLVSNTVQYKATIFIKFKHFSAYYIVKFVNTWHNIYFVP